MSNFSVSLMDAGQITESDRFAAERAYRAALVSQVPDEKLLGKISADFTAGLDGAIDHFENGLCAWSEIDRAGCNAAEAEIGYWPGEAAHFEFIF